MLHIKNSIIIGIDLHLRRRLEFEHHCTQREKEDLEDEYFANVDEIEEILESCGYNTKHVQIDDLMWMVVGSKL